MRTAEFSDSADETLRRRPRVRDSLFAESYRTPIKTGNLRQTEDGSRANKPEIVSTDVLVMVNDEKSATYRVLNYVG